MRFRIAPCFRFYTAGRAEFVTPAVNVAVAVQSLCENHPELGPKLTSAGQLRTDIGLYLNDAPQWLTGDLSALPLTGDDVIDLDYLCGVVWRE